MNNMVSRPFQVFLIKLFSCVFLLNTILSFKSTTHGYKIAVGMISIAFKCIITVKSMNKFPYIALLRVKG